MFRGYLFIVILTLLISGLAWWSHHFEPGASARYVSAAGPVSPVSDPELDPANLSSSRREVLEAMDRIVSYERYYHSVYGHFTKFLSRIGYELPKSVAEVYEVRVAAASENLLMLSAVSELKGRTGDVISVDQDYHLNASFTLPEPRPEYLRAKALRQLRTMRAAVGGEIPEEHGIFEGYFHFLSHGEGESRSVAAIGVREPVQGLQLELNAQNEVAQGANSEGEMEFPEAAISSTGQKVQSNVNTALEEARLAQTIFHGEVGRYAKNWTELSKIAGFKFEGKEQMADDGVPFGASSSIQEIDAHDLRAPAAVEAPRADKAEETASKSDIPDLEIEPLSSSP